MPVSGLPPGLLDLLPRGDGHPAIVVPASGAVLSHAALHEQVAGVAGQLAALGLRPGDRLALVIGNGPELIITFLAAAALGVAAAPLNPALPAGELAGQMAELGAGMVVDGAPAGEPAVTAASRAGLARHRVQVGAGPVAIAGTPAAAGWRAAGDASAVALLLQTSGTTSRPKTVPIRQRHLAASIRSVAEWYRLGPADVGYCVMPLFHVHGLVAGALAPLAAGGTVVVPAKFSVSAFWDDITRCGATWYTAVPTIHRLVLEAGGGRAGGHGLRFARSCSATLPAPLWRRFEAQVGVPLVEAYGMTEAAHQMASNPLPPGERRPGTVGPATGVQIAVIDDRWRPVPPGMAGEVAVRGASVVDGYLDNAEANAASFRDGWFRTGDEGRLSADGYLTLTGRIKELINRGGEKISPYEIEAVLLDHPAVREAAAFGMPDETYGEVVGAMVVTSPAASGEDLRRYCAGRLAAFKVPVMVQVRSEIPKGPTGKIQRRSLAALAGS